MTFFGEYDGCQTVIPNLKWIPIELPFPKSTRSSNKSTRIKSYDYLKLTLLFQSRNDFMELLARVPSIKHSRWFRYVPNTSSNACKVDARVHSSLTRASQWSMHPRSLHPPTRAFLV